MNVLGLVFSLMLILSYGFYACWDKQTALSRLRSTYVGYHKANRKILNSYQSEIYKNIRGKPKETKKRAKWLTAQIPKKKKADFNHECAKINLWPLIQEGREQHPVLYETAAQMIHTFYGSFSNEKRFEYRFLDALLASAKLAMEQKETFALEKLAIEEYQKVYYKMLKGTKTWSLIVGKGSPPLLDYVKVEQSNDKLCLFHAHPDLITALFNSQVAVKLYNEIHKKDGPLLTQELVQRICNESKLLSVDPDLFSLLQFGKPEHEVRKKVFIAEEKEVSLRRNLYING